MTSRFAHAAGICAAVPLLVMVSALAGDRPVPGALRPTDSPAPHDLHHEIPSDPPAPAGSIAARATSAPAVIVRGEFRSVQVNVDAAGNNILGDAANEPSIAVDPTAPSRMAIVWRQFDTITSDFRQAGRAYSQNAGATWTFPGVLEPGVFRSDPVLAADADGNFYYSSLTLDPTSPTPVFSVDVFKSTDGGVSWGPGAAASGGDKQWLTIDRSTSIGRGHIYTNWNVMFTCCGTTDFSRSTNGGASFEAPLEMPSPHMKWGTLDVGPDGTLYVAGSTLQPFAHLIAKSTNAKDATQTPGFDFVSLISLGGATVGRRGPNPDGLLGQVWVATDHSDGETRGNVYVLASVAPFSADVDADPLDVMFIRSTDGGMTWSPPVRVNDDRPDSGAWQWFGTMSVAPNGRIDVIWNDTRRSGVANLSEVYYSFSIDAGETWSPNVPITPMFDSWVGWPRQNKIGDYYHMISDNGGANLAYAATFNGEQDVYFLRIGDLDCNGNGVADDEDILTCSEGDVACDDCNENGLPDECDGDCNENMIPDECDLASGTSPDCDTNGLPDECQRDFDGDGEIDACDADRDNDGVFNELDDCDFTPLGMRVTSRGRTIGDNNANCEIDLGDLERFLTCLRAGGPESPFLGLCNDRGDFDGDLNVDLRDVAAFQNLFGPN